jgi:hypothetical protein
LLTSHHYRSRKQWLLLFLLSFAARTLFLLLLVDLNNSHYWEYGEISRNLFEGRGYSLFYLFNEKIDIYYQAAAHPYPSAYVPPGYVWFLTPFWFFEDNVLRNVLILSLQNLVSLGVMWLLFKVVMQWFNSERAAWIAAIIYGFIPEMIYSANSFGPTVFYHLVVCGLLLQANKPLQNKKYSYYLSIICGRSLPAFRNDSLHRNVDVLPHRKKGIYGNS